MGTPVICCPLRPTPAAGTGGQRRSQGQPSSLLQLWWDLKGSFFLALRLPITSHSATCYPGTAGHRPYLSLQRHGPQGQVAHGLICDLPAPHREVVEGVRQFFGVILGRDLKQSARQWQSVPVGTWAGGWHGVPS